ncbi:SufS family cysteine desulfurase [Candidatus Dependentiae bacterium]|nr:SufS family cysteine desulfurase [Candidatus Dependentiae bacterium]
MKNFDAEKLKKDFPILHKKSDLYRFIYLDNAATTQKPKFVIDFIKNFYERYNANVYRSIHDLGEEVTTLYEDARAKIAKFINADTQEVIFTSGTTESINFVADAWLAENLKKDNEIVITQAEHHANFLPWLRLAQKKDSKIKFIDLNLDTFSFNNFDPDTSDLINENTKLVAIIHSSNVLGDIWDKQEQQLKKLIEKAHKVGAKVLLDCAQTISRKKIDVKDLDVDFIAFSGHKMIGPTGIGVLFIKKEMHEVVEPYRVGGSMVSFVAWNSASWRKAPNKYEAGTPPIAQAIGLGKAIDYLNQYIDFGQLKIHEAKLCSYLIDGLQKIKEVKIIGNIERLKTEGHLVCFVVDGIHAHDVSAFLSKDGISVRSGNHCAQPLTELLGIDSSVRVSFYLYNTMRDVDIFLESLEKVINFFKK